MTQPVTADQLRNLTDRAARGPLTADEQQRLREGIAQLEALQQIARGYCPDCGRGDAAPTVTDWEQQKQRADHAETELAGVRTLRDRWVKAGPPPLGTPTSRWWDRRLAELGAALRPEEQPGPAAAQDHLAQDGVHTPGCDCGHDGMGVSWHADECPWRRSVVDCPGRPTPG
ncbi:hypothetical protein [Streptomyces europaeiscabiei]|uniref:hypothetical protein n=1 Tax=Streptomyces europaeiscabiei TaxID=146819 RepID=UPI0029A92BDA|nr:hypothetical protein [Streptomyces europaeiscabiei]MDX3835626.1 hypothetical protein [Streptomyces europaeiscabiei]